MYDPMSDDRTSARPPAAASGAPAEEDTREPPGLPAVWLPIVGLAWLASGGLFATNADHFGPGFLPMLVWMFSYPVVAIAQIIGAIVQLHRYQDGKFGGRFEPWRLAIWGLAGAAYIAVPIVITLA
ncbi:hypothetical protein H0E84_00790 [Luteimonas sp. SJ-92]|uniref:Uncharacterized protein n=1 Tax=Luteimonas salinisoli TaxID=2752307 RepID=A0A853J779_9GAMM|nr:hypothetical protein [Luteimonas salinisoli]NZA24911.1 hypothetical protein [Luteimonas salinisoli]